ncbi:hypothetical protein V6N11_036263 [Hibiscus sabdariffa]|uniref:Disease resistance R13L4/SHOC-2-like LRR domain-containing protein n=1 Tax=Hibiscus sabdariffa TaxID=183260 RepID=A0ABR2R9X9_9ROSI
MDELIQLWIGEGFLDGPNPHGLGAFTLDTLEFAYLLEIDESKQCVEMHDMIRHAALWLARDQGRKENNVLVSKVPTPTFAHRLVPNLTTLILRDGQLQSFPEGLFDSMPALKVLDLSGNRWLTELPSDVGNVTTLHYINLSFTSLAELSAALGDLINLKCLLLDYTMNLKCIPKELISKLLTLQVYSKMSRVGDCFGSAASVPCGEIAFLQVLECLDCLNKIGITIFCATSLEKILQSPILRSWDRNLVVMECINLVSLHFTEKVFSLERLEIFCCNSLKELKASDRCKLCNLNSLSIRFCPLLSELNFLSYGRNLESLTTSMQNLKKICPSPDCFPFLSEFRVYKCPLLSQIPFDMENANSLQKIVGEREWWDDLIWCDGAVKDICLMKFVSS